MDNIVILKFLCAQRHRGGTKKGNNAEGPSHAAERAEAYRGAFAKTKTTRLRNVATK